MQKIINFLWSVFHKPEDPVITKFRKLLDKYPAHEWKYTANDDDIYILTHPGTSIKLWEFPWTERLKINRASNGEEIDEKLYQILVDQQRFYENRIQKEKDGKIINDFLEMEI